MLLHKMGGLTVVNTEFREGVLNVVADSLSRGADPLSRDFKALARGVDPRARGFHIRNSFTQVTAPPILKDLSKLLDPSFNIMVEELLYHQWNQFSDLIEKLFEF